MKDKIDIIIGIFALIGILSIVLFISNLFSDDKETACRSQEQEALLQEQEIYKLEEEIFSLENTIVELEEKIETLNEQIDDIEDDCQYSYGGSASIERK